MWDIVLSVGSWLGQNSLPLLGAAFTLIKWWESKGSKQNSRWDTFTSLIEEAFNDVEALGYISKLTGLQKENVFLGNLRALMAGAGYHKLTDRELQAAKARAAGLAARRTVNGAIR